MPGEVPQSPFQLDLNQPAGIECFAVELSELVSGNPNHYYELQAHYRLMRAIRRSPFRGAALLYRLASTDSVQVRAEAALAAAYLAQDQPILASDVWIDLRGREPMVHGAVQQGITLAVDLGYLALEQADTIRHSAHGLRTEVPAD